MNKLTLINCFVVEDERVAQEIITDYIQDTESLRLVGMSYNKDTLVGEITTSSPDLIFLDMHLPGKTGFQVLECLPTPLPLIIVTTAHPQYALEGYKHSVLDYLIKPFDYERFVLAIAKASDLLAIKHQLQINTSEPHYLSIRVDRGVTRIPIADILYIESMDSYVKIYHQPIPQNRIELIVSKIALFKLEEQLPLNKFLRISRRIVVQSEKINQLKENNVHLYNGTILAVGSTFKDAVRHYFQP